MASPPEATETTLWTWIHLSDIHIGHGGTAWTSDQKDVLSQVATDLEQMIQGGIPTPKAIVVTGDVAYSGGCVRHEEYEEAESLIERLQALVGGHTSVFAVPGNHDVQRTRSGPGSAYRLISNLREGMLNANFEDSVEDPEDGGILRARFANYTAFAERVGSPRPGKPDGMWVHEVSLVGGFKLRLIGWNTALLSNDDNDRRRLRIGKVAVNAAVSDTDDNILLFALTHHPADWLAEDDEKYLVPRLLRSVDAHFHGHVHQPNSVKQVRGTGQELITITAGALHAEEELADAQLNHAYSVGALVSTQASGLELRIWPRRWSTAQAKWIPDTDSLSPNSTYITHQLRRASLPSDGTATENTMRHAAEKSLTRVGRRRTAYPTDMSINELSDADLIVPTAFGQRGAAINSPTTVESAAATVPTPSLLILGAPGAGKTVVSYLLARGILEHTDQSPLFVDLIRLNTDNPTVADLMEQNEASSGTTTVAEGVVVIVDGADEAIASGLSPATVAARLAALSTLGPIVVLCRVNDYEGRLASLVRDDLFDHILLIRDWDPAQFAEFVGRLHAKGHLPDERLIQRVESDPGLTALVRRPLLARMLAFLADLSELPTDTTALYTVYLNRLAAVTDQRLQAAGCARATPAMSRWRDTSWKVFRGGLNAEAMPLDKFTQASTDDSASVECASRAIAGIVDISAGNDATFVHYSFYEFLIAQHLAEQLLAVLPTNPQQAARLMTRHLPSEIRRHLVKILRMTAMDIHRWPDHLAEVYQQAGSLPSSEECLVVRNLIAYIMCRLDVPADKHLMELLQVESNPFLRNSLLWALTRLNNLEALRIYLEELGSDQELASLNRGYLLYYFGDLGASISPPHPDNPPHTSWAHTREILTAKYASESYANVPAARKAIDLYTFCDIAAVRQEQLTVEEADLFTLLIEYIGPQIPASVQLVLEAQLERVRQCDE